jgi:MFS family permease
VIWEDSPVDDAPRTSGPRGELFGPTRRSTTVGVLLLVVMVAFESMGVGTAMPALVAEFGALSLYALPFVSFMAASVFGTVVGGRWCDRSGPRPVLLAGPTLFGLGLITAGSAFEMPQVLAGRVLQGLGAGGLLVAVYVLIGVVYPDGVRPSLFGLMSSGWVLPTLIGPPLAGLVTEHFSWRWVFFGLVPVVAVALALVVPAVRRLEPPEPRHGTGRRGVVLAAAGAAVGVSTLSASAERPGVVGAVLAGCALVVLVPALRRLLPDGVFRAGIGIPTVVACRGLCAGLFNTATSYLPLMLTATHHWPLSVAGMPLMCGSLGWSAAAAWQGRHPGLPRPRLMRAGFWLLMSAALILQFVAPSWGVAWLALPVWMLAGCGMGLVFPSISFLLLRQSEPGRVGFNTSAAQVCDQLGSATLIGVGGTLLAMLGSPSAALPVLFALLAGLGLTGILVAPRSAPR